MTYTYNTFCYSIEVLRVVYGRVPGGDGGHVLVVVQQLQLVELVPVLLRKDGVQPRHGHLLAGGMCAQVVR